MFRYLWITVVTGLVITVAYGAHRSPSGNSPSASDRPDLVVGHDGCVKCHVQEVNVWKQTPHFKTFEELSRRPAAKQIATKLGVSSIKHDGRCVKCHFTHQTTGSSLVSLGNQRSPVRAEPISGVSCESCHGPARNWLESHHDYGGPEVTRGTESPDHRLRRIEHAVSLGMRNPRNPYRIAQSCYECHTVPDEELVNVGGHPAGSLDFELVSWSQGMVHHNFASSDNQTNRPSSPERLRVLFAAGLIADLEFSLRATAAATKKDTYAVTVAQRANRSGARLKSAAEKTQHPLLKKASELFSTVALKLNNAEQLTRVADQIGALGIELGNTETGANLGTLDGFIPPKERWK